jgi:hypothetical protein
MAEYKKAEQYDANAPKDPSRRGFLKGMFGGAVTVGAGLTGLVALTEDAEAESFDYKTNFNETNLASYDIPDFTKYSPIAIDDVEKSHLIMGAETKMCVYNIDQNLIFVWSYNGNIFGVGKEIDKKKPLDLSLLALEREGKFSKESPYKKHSVPSWARK